MFNGFGYLPEIYATKEEVEIGVEKNKWIMDDWDIVEVEVDEKELIKKS